MFSVVLVFGEMAAAARTDTGYRDSSLVLGLTTSII